MIYHVCNSSIADFVIFNNYFEFLRMLMTVCYYQTKNPSVNFGVFIRSQKSKMISDVDALTSIINMKNNKIVEIIAYCLMPTHLHLILNELIEGGVSIFLNNILNSYTRYFNIKHHRKGPLWVGRSKKILIDNDEQFLWTTSYLHLNPVTACLVDRPEQWPYSSYREYIEEITGANKICKYKDLVDIESNSYRKYVESNISYQRELAKAKKAIFE